MITLRNENDDGFYSPISLFEWNLSLILVTDHIYILELNFLCRIVHLTRSEAHRPYTFFFNGCYSINFTIVSRSYSHTVTLMRDEN